jgi:hypothetical protein
MKEIEDLINAGAEDTKNAKPSVVTKKLPVQVRLNEASWIRFVLIAIPVVCIETCAWYFPASSPTLSTWR